MYMYIYIYTYIDLYYNPIPKTGCSTASAQRRGINRPALGGGREASQRGERRASVQAHGSRCAGSNPKP